MRRVPLLLLVLATLGAGAFVAPTMAGAAPASYDALVVTSDPTAYGDTPRPWAATRVYTSAPELNVTTATADHLVVSGDDGDGHEASVSFTPRLGQVFTTGALISLAPTRSNSRGAGLVTFGDAGCAPDENAGYNYGFMKVEEVSIAPDGSLLTLSAHFGLACTSTPVRQEFRGLVRFHSATPWATVRTAAETPDLGTTRLGRPANTSVDVTVVGQGDSTVGRPEFEAVADTTLVGTTCADVLRVGDTCRVSIRFAPRAAGVEQFTLSFDDGIVGVLPVIGLRATALDTQIGTFHPTGPTRVLDTRTTTGGHRGALGPGASAVVRPDTGADPASAYVLNLTAVNPTASGYLTAYPSGKPVPGTASLNLAGGRTVAHLVTVPAGADGSITVRNAAGTTHVVADLVGWYSADDGPLATGAVRGGGYHRGGVQRLLDTRSGQPVYAGTYVTVSARYPARHVAALAVNVTVTAPAASGYVTAWNAATDTPPLASTLNFGRGETVSNAAIVPASACTTATGCTDSATIGIANRSGGAVQVIVDVTGWFDDGTGTADVRFHPLATPTRVVDTRQALGTTPFTAGGTHTFVPSVVGPGTVALDADVTAVRPTRSTYLTFWPATDRYQRPRASTLNAAPGRIVGNHVLAAVGGEAGGVNVFNFTGGVDVVADVNGTFDAFPSPPYEGIQNFRDANLPTSDSPVGPVRRPVG